MKKLVLFASLLLSTEMVFAVSDQDVKNVIECKSGMDDLNSLTTEKLKVLGWRKKAQANIYLDVYQAKQPHEFFGIATTKIALVPGGIIALYSPNYLDKFKQNYQITANSMPFKGEKTLETGTSSWGAYEKVLTLSDLINTKDKTRYTAIGCRFNFR